MQSTITFSKEDEDLLRVTMKFTFEDSKGPVLRRRLANQHYRLYPMDRTKMPIAGVAVLTGQANTSIHNEFVIQRIYEIPENFDKNATVVREHAERYYLRVMEDLKEIP